MEGERILHYRVLGPLGQGGMGEVVLAQDERLGRRVALKFLSGSFSEDPQARDRLQREARSLAALSHPHIAAIHALEESGERPFLVMEYVEGETLAQAISRRPLPVEEVISVALAMAEALAHAHARGVIHRDVKPANILIRPDGAATLTDFGIADLESATRLTAEGYTPGTVAYMSPEQARGARVDARSDLFSLGAVLYEALTGARPFAGGRPESALYAVQHHEPEPPSAMRTGVPLELERIVLKCLKKDPSHRYQHADDLVADLRALRATSAVAAGAPPPSRAAGTGLTATAPAATGTASPAVATATATAEPATPPSPGRRVRRAALLTVAALLALALVYLAGRPGSDDHGTAAAAEKSIAVLSFQNLAEPGDPSGTSPVATSLLSVGLGEMQVMPVMSAQRIHVVMREMGKTDPAVRGTDALEVARKAGASHVITGFIYSLTPEVVLGAEVASTSDGKVLTATRVRTAAGPSALFAAVDSLTRSLCEGLARSGFTIRSTGVDVAGLTTRDPIAYRSYARGLDRLYLGATEEAGREFQKAIQADSSFALAWYYAAIANWWSGEYVAAEDEVRAALRLGSRLTPREREGLAALDPLVRGKYQLAANAYQSLLTRYPDDKEFAYGLGEALYHQGTDLASARAALEQATRTDASFGVAYIHQVDIALLDENFDAALAHVDRLRTADPDYPGGHMLRGRVLSARGDAGGALAAYRNAILVEPRLANAWFEIVRIHSILGQFDSARVAMKRLAEFHEPNALLAARASRFVLNMARGRYGEVIQTFESLPESLTANPMQNVAPIRYYYAVAQTERGDVTGAIDEYRRLGANPMARRALGRCSQADELAEIYIGAGRLSEAEALLRECDRMLVEAPKKSEIDNRTYIAGIVALARGRHREAISLLEKSRTISPPGRSEAQRSGALARAYALVGDTLRAVTALERVISRGAESYDVVQLFHAMNSLAGFYERMGRREDALKLYRRVDHQFREADPGLKIHETARAGIRRLTRA